MSAIISCLHASYGRPKKAIACMRMWFERAANPENLEWILALNDDDPDALATIDGVPNELAPQVKVVRGMFPGSAPAWDAAAKESTGHLLVQVSDDVEPPAIFDAELAAAIRHATPTDKALATWAVETPIVIRVSDGYRKDKLMVTAIINRARYEQVGYFLFPGYNSVYSDDDFSVRVYADADAGRCSLIEARDLIFLHRHAYHDPSVPTDFTYARQNSSVNYALGQKLFMERNGHLLRYRTWV